MGHDWALSWPGNYCKRCHADDPMETAVGCGWYDPFEDKWLSEDHRDLVLLLQNCLLELTEENRAVIMRHIQDLEEKVGGQDGLTQPDPQHS